jgi:hypothetical protein
MDTTPVKTTKNIPNTNDKYVPRNANIGTIGKTMEYYPFENTDFIINLNNSKYK